MPFVIIIILVLVALYFIKRNTGSDTRTLFYRKRSPKEIGDEGEAQVSRLLGLTVPGERYIFNNYILKRGNSSAQIDHILVSRFGVYVIETKNYAGMIAGNHNATYWSQTLDYGAVKNKMYNPVKQNERHVEYVKRLLPPGTPIFSMVVFVRADIRYVNSPNVYTYEEFSDILRKDASALLQPSQIKDVAERLTRAQANHVISDEDHIQNVQIIQEKIENGICPRCNAKLVLRHGRYGDFLGCENYPRCTFIKKGG